MATGRKTVTVGQVIDPNTWGNLVWDQSVQSFASDADRTAQFPVPVRKAGAVTWLDDVQRFDGWNGAAWVPLRGFATPFLFANDFAEAQSPTPGQPIRSVSALLTLPPGTTWLVQGSASAAVTNVPDHLTCVLYDADVAGIPGEVANSRGTGGYNTVVNTGVSVLTRQTLVTVAAVAKRVQVGVSPQGTSTLRLVSLAVSPVAWIVAQRIG